VYLPSKKWSSRFYSLASVTAPIALHLCRSSLSFSAEEVCGFFFQAKMVRIFKGGLAGDL
jgi:hypothetical protein